MAKKSGKEVLVEVVPPKKLDELNSIAEAVSEAELDGIDLPEAPMGVPVGSAPVIAAYLHAKYGVKVVPHLRVTDMNSNAIVNVARALALLGVDRLVLIRGDEPALGRIVEDVSVERAAQLVKKFTKSKLKVGALLSPRYPLGLVEERVKSEDIDFFLMLRPLHSHERLKKVRVMVERAGKKLLAYIIVKTPRNAGVLSKILRDQPTYAVNEVLDIADKLAGYTDGFVISAPHDLQAAVRLGRTIKLKY
ncbi:MAG: methylenetetrahydrofolate reductase [Thermoproteota archaeon]